MVSPHRGGKNPSANSPKIIIPENVSEFYANACFVGMTDFDFMLLFGSMTLPSNIGQGSQQFPQEVRVDAVVRMSPQQAKASLRGLQQAINDFEAKHGEINIPAIPQEVKNADNQNR